jgi:hypothetical protein
MAEVLTFEFITGCSLTFLDDLVIGSSLFNHTCEINNRDVRGWDTHGHASEFAVEGWNHFSDGLGCAGTAGDDVLGSGTATSPILARWTIDSLLSSSIRVDSCHQALLETELVIDDLCQWCKAVGSAGGIGDDGNVGFVGLVVDAHDEHWSIGRGSRYDDLLSTTLQMSRSFLCGCEDTGGFDDVLCTALAPWDLSGVFLHVEFDCLAIDDETVALDLDCALELSVCRVILQHVCLHNS